MQLMQSVKQFDPSGGISVEEMIFLLAVAAMLEQAFEHVGAEQPEWLKDKKGLLEKEIKARLHDELQRQLKEVLGEEEALKSREEKRGDLSAKRKRLEDKLAKA